MGHRRGPRWEYVLPIAVGAFVFLSSLITVLMLDEEAALRFLGEGGPAEVGSVVSYILAAVVLLLLWLTRQDGAFALRTCVFPVLLAARELDFHTRFTSEGIFRSSFYFRDIASVPEKVVVSVILLATFVMVIWYIRSYAGLYLRGLVDRVPWVLSVILGFGLMALGKLADSSTWIVRTVGLERNFSVEMVNVFEECAEFAGASVVFVAAILYAHARVTRRESSRGRSL